MATDSYGNADDGVKDGKARSALVVAVLLALAGCTLIGGKPEHPAVTYDLRRPPTRADVGIPDGEKVVVDEANDGCPVTLLLPEGRRLKTKVNLVTFDSFGGYLTVRLQGRYSPLDERASVAYTLDFVADG